jgi:hypothetical protein
MSLWEELPDDLLRKKRRGFSRLDYDVQRLIVKLARDQGYKCAHCSQSHDLIIEHDHFPELGPGEKPTIFNIRGLVCGRCNWHIGMYEAEARGEYSSWPDRLPRVSEDTYWGYVYDYQIRVWPLVQAELEKRLGSQNYWRRRLFLQKFDDWLEYPVRRRYPWYWGFAEIKDKKYGPIRTPKQALRVLHACMLFVVEQLRKDPEYQPPASFLKLMIDLEPFFDGIRATVEERATSTENNTLAAP